MEVEASESVQLKKSNDGIPTTSGAAEQDDSADEPGRFLRWVVHGLASCKLERLHSSMEPSAEETLSAHTARVVVE